MGFFDFTHRFFDRLSMIEEKTPQQRPFQRCVARVFSGMLTICSVAQEYAEKKRFSEQPHPPFPDHALFLFRVLTFVLSPRKMVQHFSGWIRWGSFGGHQGYGGGRE
jgi:hypothetical protein